MRTSKIFWEFFSSTGNIGAYLIYKEITKNQGAEYGYKKMKRAE
ncbi:MAG: YqzL-like protein [Peptococcaceae bacterium]|jgi:hypothetical protein|nr:YqzL-like protein [Peptococcaceae bacterium]